MVRIPHICFYDLHSINQWLWLSKLNSNKGIQWQTEKQCSQRSMAAKHNEVSLYVDGTAFRGNIKVHSSVIFVIMSKYIEKGMQKLMLVVQCFGPWCRPSSNGWNVTWTSEPWIFTWPQKAVQSPYTETVIEVTHAGRAIENNKSVWSDGIVGDLIKYWCKTMCGMLWTLFNLVHTNE